MTTADGRRTVSYLVKCALSAGDSLIKRDQDGATYTFPGGLGFAPEWKTGTCEQDCQELMSACLMAHVNTYGVHYPIWIDSPYPGVGWGLPPSNYQMEGTFFGNIMATGPMNHGSLSAPLGYYCDGPGVATNSLIVAGRLGDVNSQGTPPFYNAYLGSACGWAGHCDAHLGQGGTADGYTRCTDTSGNTFTNLATVWRDPKAAMSFDPNYLYSLRSMIGSTGLALNVEGGVYANGTPVWQWRYVGSNKLRISDSGAGNGTYKISFWENQGKCLDNPGGQTANGTPAQVWDCLSNDPWQQWTIRVDMSTGAAYFKNAGSGKCLDDSGSSNPGVAPWLWDCDPSNVNQKWRVSGGYWRPVAPTGFVIHDTDAYVLLAADGATNAALDGDSQYANGHKVHLASAADLNVDDKVRIVPGSAAGTWTIRFAGADGAKCLDEPGSQTANGTLLETWDCNGGANQNWIIKNDPAGGVTVQNQASGRCLGNFSAHGGDLGASIGVWDCSPADWSQMWALTAN